MQGSFQFQIVHINKQIPSFSQVAIKNHPKLNQNFCKQKRFRCFKVGF